MKCGDFPGPGVERHIVANPFQEIFHADRGDRYEQLFNEYKETHGKVYANDREHSNRLKIFTNNVRFVFTYMLCHNKRYFVSARLILLIK